MMNKRKYKNKKLLLPFLLGLSCITLCGCWDQQLLGDIRIELSLGMELGDDNSLLVTRNAPIFEEEIQARSEVISTDVYSLRESRGVASALSAYRIAGGKIQQLMLSRELAEKGISDILNVSERDPVNPFNAFLVIVDGSPKELLKAAANFNDKPRPANYLNGLLQNNVKTLRVPETRVHNFFTDYFAPGIDPIVPRIELETDENKGIRVKGCALFSEDKVVGELDGSKTSLLLIMMDKLKGGSSTSQMSRLPDEDNLIKGAIPIGIGKAKRKIDIKIKDNKPYVNISLKLSGDVTDYKWDGISKREVQKEFEKRFSKQLKERCEEVIKDTQKVGSDPIGIGSMVRAKYNDYWKSIKWEEAYKQAVIKVDVKYDINTYGALK